MAGRRRNPDPSDADAALWGRVIETVSPLPGRAKPPPPVAVPPVRANIRTPAPLVLPPVATSPGRMLDKSWDRDLKRGAVMPNRTIDLHDQTLAAAHARVDRELDAARRDGERVLLLITGKARPDARAGRGAIRALIGDWLAASRHAGAIAAVRPAHPRHGGAGALYVILRRR